MKRRRFFQAAAAIPAGLAFGQAPVGVGAGPAPGTGAGEYPKIDVSGPDQASEGVQKYFSAAQFATLTRLSTLLMPKGFRGPCGSTHFS